MKWVNEADAGEKEEKNDASQIPLSTRSTWKSKLLSAEMKKGMT